MRESNNQQRSSYFIAYAGAIAIHLGVAILLFVPFTKKHTIIATPIATPMVIEQKETIDAIAIDEKALEQEIQRIENIEKEKKRQEIARKEKLERERQEIARKRKAEEARLAKIKAEQEALKDKLAEKERLEKIAEIERKAKLKYEQEQLEKLKKEKEEALKAKQEAEKQRQLAEEKRKKEEEIAKQKEKERLERLAKEEKARQLKIEQEQKARAQMLVQNQIQQYAGLIQSKIHQNWRQPLGVELAGIRCKLTVKLSASGEVLEAKVTETSGNIEFDRSTELAVMKSSPLPMPSEPDARAQFRQFTFTFNPEAV